MRSVLGNGPHRASRSVMQVALLFLAIMVAACSTPPTIVPDTEETTFLTPVPESTLAAFDWSAPIESELQAVIAARAGLSTTRMDYEAAPEVLSVEKMTREDAHRRIAKAGAAGNETRPGETPVWLVLFEGDYQILPPDPEHTITPPPPRHGCSFVILDAEGGGGSEVGTLECPS